MADEQRTPEKLDASGPFDHKDDKDMRHDRDPGVHTGGDPNRNRFTFSFWYFIIFFLLLTLVNSLLVNSALSGRVQEVPVTYDRFKELIADGEIKGVEISEDYYLGYPEVTESDQGTVSSSQPMTVYTTVIVKQDPSFISLLDEKGVHYAAQAPKRQSRLLDWLLPTIFFIIIWRLIFRRMGMGGQGQGVLSFAQNNSKIVAEKDSGIRFADVAGEDEAKQELEEVVDFLKRPEKYTAMGAKIPKGVLLVGPPGTGKTLLAKAVAGEAGVPFYKMSGSDFVEMFVGVGAARVRDLFKQAREHSPCIIFIDEIDAIGRKRSSAEVGGNDEREQTLNQMLVEMDGFDSRTGVIILAATNRPEVLDSALLRPGRFDRQVLVDKPDLEGRLAILKIHTKGMKLGPDVDLRKVAQATAGLAGADLANIANEAALMAVRAHREQIAQVDFEEAFEKSIAGLQRKSRVMNEKERTRVAYHETGHALTAFMTPGAEPVTKISIVPRGMGALGYTMQTPTEDRYLMSTEELLGSVDTMLGGRAAEETVFGDISTGASNDISRASDLVRKMITEYGMSEKFRNMTLPTQNNGIAVRDYSEATQNYIDTETSRIINERYAVVLQHLKDNRKALEDIAQKLLKDEVVEGADFQKMAEADVVMPAAKA